MFWSETMFDTQHQQTLVLNLRISPNVFQIIAIQYVNPADEHFLQQIIQFNIILCIQYYLLNA